ncbi:glycosyltransferase family 32 protein [Alkalihalobacterium chitinilyticum]|uniref:Glycosyltransferase n=1 Tax=Alkalihalobacterium chitinilyticum TaxID=2980103 RepID=A0ABT5VF54_9BACI|nr:glycosyltransferase [Alkalihalobacterium chitinilyticum]MDE5413791.1 glycosyltransferase [Alkalihalobacterium chitinilyticum]
MSTNRNIPKIIHYCWFGNNEKPDIVKKCIASWNKHLSDYEIKEWNEKNFDFSSNAYANEAYQNKKFAFVSDYVRVHVLYHIGGIYLDTDVEVFKSFDDLLHLESFWGFEQESFIGTSTIGSKKGNPLIKMFLDSYEDKNFVKENGMLDQLTNVAIISELLQNKGLKLNGKFQELDELGTFFPQTYFSPYDYINCRKFITKDTYAMHHFYKSWLPPKARMKGNLKFLASKIIGGNNIARIRKLVSKN